LLLFIRQLIVVVAFSARRDHGTDRRVLRAAPRQELAAQDGRADAVDAAAHRAQEERRRQADLRGVCAAGSGQREGRGDRDAVERKPRQHVAKPRGTDAVGQQAGRLGLALWRCVLVGCTLLITLSVFLSCSHRRDRQLAASRNNLSPAQARAGQGQQPDRERLHGYKI